MSSGLIGALVAESRPRVLAALLRAFRDLDTAEELFQEACLRATEHWVRDGVPRDATAWLIRVARNAGLDRIRKDRRLSFGDVELASDSAARTEDRQAEVADTLNHAVAVSKVDGPEAALALLGPLATDLARYRPFHTARAALLEQIGDTDAAIAAFEDALGCAPTRQEADYLTQKIAALRLERITGSR